MDSQLSLFSDDPLRDALARLRPSVPVEITYRSTRRQLYAWKRDRETGAITLRIKDAFRGAPPEVASAVLRVVLRPRLPRAERRRLSFVISSWANGIDPVPAPASSGVPVSEGRYVDLVSIRDEVVKRRFDASIETDIGWAERPARRLMGRFERRAPRSLILINPLLDSPVTPPWYLDFLVFHELLHALHPPRPGAGRLAIHPPEFRRVERTHPDFTRAKQFEKWAGGAGFRVLLARERAPQAIPHAFRT